MGRIIKKFFRKIKQPKVLVSIFLASIMIFSILGFMMSYQMDNRTTKLEYNGYKFTQFYDGIQTKINGQKFNLNYFPEQLDTINISSAAKVILKSLFVFSITYDSNSEYKEYFSGQQFELAENLEKIEKYVSSGMTNNTGFEQIPQITCKNATQTVPVIIFQEADQTSIQFNNNCIIANISSINDVYRVGDLLFYTMAGVMK